MGILMSEEECKIEWIMKKGKSPEKAGIYDKDNNLIREVKYIAGVHIENYFNTQLSELIVIKRVEKMYDKEYTSYTIKKNIDDIKCICFDHNCINY